MYHCASFPATSNTLGNILSREQRKKHPASTAFTLVSHQSHNARAANCHFRGSGERDGEQKNKVKQNHDVSVGAAVVGKKAHLGTKRC